MMRPSCKKEWMKGIASMSEYSGAYSDDQHTHYYNPLKSDYYGKSTPYLTYPHRMASKPKNAKNVINTYLNKIGTEGCFALGKSLHFVIDTTMPAHTSGFGPTSKPTGLLAALEAYVPSIQNKYPISGVWDKRWKNKNPVDMVDEIAKTSNLKFAKTLFAQLLKKGATCHMKPEGCNQNYYGYCFVNQPHVKGTLGDALKDAYQSVASWIYSICTVRNYN